MSTRPTIRHLLLSLNLLILLVPVAAVVFLPVFDAYLLRQTERILIAESIVVAEAWRDRWFEERAPFQESSESFRPADRKEEPFTPYAAILGLRYKVLPPQPAPGRRAEELDHAKAAAGDAIAPLLRRTQVFNLSGVRVMDENGCVLSSSRGDAGECFDNLEEVRTAMGGQYGAVVRQRLSDSPVPPITSIRRRGKFRVFTATPIFANGEVVGIVRMSRTAVSPLEAIWNHKEKFALVLLVCLVLTPALTYTLSHAISKPVRTLTASADAIARGEPGEFISPSPLSPREMVTLNAALRRMTEQLTQRASYIRDFASNVSHELKSPLTSISGAIELLQDRWNDMSEAQRKRFLDNVALDAENMNRLVARLLHLARIQSVPEESREIDVTSFVKSIVARYNHPIEVEAGAGIPMLRMNPDHLEAALRNLLDNAIRHGPGKPVEVSIGTKGTQVTISVRDRGPGISEADRPRVFERFFTTERDRGGTGLGLSIVQAVAHTRGGGIEFETGDGGTTFHLTL